MSGTRRRPRTVWAVRYLTRDWASGALSEAEWAERWEAFEDHRRSVAPTLDHGAEHLVIDINLHDAVAKACTIDGGSLAIRFVAGDLQRGYEFVELTYLGATIRGASAEDIHAWLTAPETEVWYDEVDRRGERYIHRYLLHPDGEFDLEFSRLQVNREPAQPDDR